MIAELLVVPGRDGAVELIAQDSRTAVHAVRLSPEFHQSQDTPEVPEARAITRPTRLVGIHD